MQTFDVDADKVREVVDYADMDNIDEHTAIHLVEAAAEELGIELNPGEVSQAAMDLLNKAREETDPEPLAHAAVQSIRRHQAEGCGLRPVKEWTDADVTDSGIHFDVLSGNGLVTSDQNESKLDAIVSAVVFGAFHQDSDYPSIVEAKEALAVGGYAIAALEFNAQASQYVCPITNQTFTVGPGYWPAIDGAPVSITVFDEETSAHIASIITGNDWQNRSDPQKIAGYFVFTL